jgi:hypothetical protein
MFLPIPRPSALNAGNLFTFNKNKTMNKTRFSSEPFLLISLFYIFFQDPSKINISAAL